MATIAEMIREVNDEGYFDENAEAKVCQASLFWLYAGVSVKSIGIHLCYGSCFPFLFCFPLFLLKLINFVQSFLKRR